MQTRKPQRAAIPSAGRCVPFSLMQPFQWDGKSWLTAALPCAALQEQAAQEPPRAPQWLHGGAQLGAGDAGQNRVSQP